MSISMGGMVKEGVSLWDGRGNIVVLIGGMGGAIGVGTGNIGNTDLRVGTLGVLGVLEVLGVIGLLLGVETGGGGGEKLGGDLGWA